MAAASAASTPLRLALPSTSSSKIGQAERSQTVACRLSDLEWSSFKGFPFKVFCTKLGEFTCQSRDS